jgi:hypothetical protein
MADIEQFQRDLEALGFKLVQESARGVAQFSLNASRYLTYWVHWDLPAEQLLFTWEHALGEYLGSMELQIGAHDELSDYLYPKYDARGPVDITFVVDEMDRAEQILRAVNLLEGPP